MRNLKELADCQICEKTKGFKFVYSKQFNEQVWICVNCLAFGKQKGYFTHKETKIKRNDRCPCGSGKKYKHCCIEKVRDFSLKEAEKKDGQAS